MTNAEGEEYPITLAIGVLSGTNVLAATTATNVSFFAVPISALGGDGGTGGQIPWIYAGSGSLNSATGLWEMQWTPPTSQILLYGCRG